MLNHNTIKTAGAGLIAVTATVLCLLMAQAAQADTWTINNCPSAPGANSNAGAYSIFSSPEADQATCSPSTGGWIGPASASMYPNSSAGITLEAPSGVAIRHASFWWSVPQSNGAPNFADIATNTGAVSQNLTPLNDTASPLELTLPSTTWNISLFDYCSSGDGPTGCSFGPADDPVLQMYGAQLTLETANAPTGTATGGALTSNSTLRASQSLVYQASDPTSGVHAVKLLIDGTQVAENNYQPQCPYENVLACPGNISDTITWNTASVTDGQHTLEAIVQDAAQNTTIFYAATITTNNAPATSANPTITAPAGLAVGSPATVEPGTWTTPAGAGTTSYAYQWQDCNSEGAACQPITGARAQTYTPASGDAGHTLRTLVTATDSDGAATIASTQTSIIPTPNQPREQQPAGNVLNTTLTADTPNGTPASENATITLTTPTRLTRSYANRAFMISGRLTNTERQPIANATLEVLAQTEATNTTTLIERVTTTTSGAFAATIPSGPSRTITLAYRALSNDANYAASAYVHENVAASVHLTITQRHTNPTGTITIEGTIQGPIPPQGIRLELLVYYLGGWRPIRNPHTSNIHHGTVKLKYHFHDAIGRFPFELRIPANQANYPYTTGKSNTIAVTT